MLAHFSQNCSKRDLEIGKIISENIYFLGYEGDNLDVIQLAVKINSIFEEFDISVLLDVFEDFLIGKTKIKFKISIVDISESLSERGVKTKKERAKIIEAQKFYNDFNEFSKDLGK